jgi:uncharacterized protein YhaN
MKVLELSLLAFGPFTDVVLDLSGGQEGLHMIFGPNEAGKSSALRGLRQALFGIPAQSADNFVHSYTKMRIGLTLRGGDGRTLRFIRRKGNRNTLLAADGATPLPDEALRPFLGGLAESEFGSRFALDHDELVGGGKAILQGGGELGALLFQAGGGLKNLQEMQRQLDKEIEALFKPTGARPRINAGLAELKAANDVKRQASLHSAEWVEHETAHRAAVAGIEEVEGRLAAAHAEKRRLERLRDALPLLSRQRRCQEELASLGPIVLLPERFQKDRLEALSRREASRAAKERAEAAVVELDRRLAELAVPEDLLAEGDAIERLREGQAADRKARKALPAEEARLLQALIAAHELLAESWPELTPGRAEYDTLLPAVMAAGERLRLTRAQRAAIQDLASDRTRLAAEHVQTLKTIAEHTEQLQVEQAALEELPPPREVGSLEVALGQARDLGDLDGALEAARNGLARAEQDAARRLSQLTLWDGTLEALEAARAPAAETVDRFDDELAQAEAEREQLRKERQSAVDEKVEAEGMLELLRQSAGSVPTEDDLSRARADRDRLWTLIRRAWEDGRLPGTGDPGGLLEPGQAADVSPKMLADRFEQLKLLADSHADRLRREAERVAQQAAALASLRRSRRRLEFLDSQEEQLIRRGEEIAGRWRAAWAGLCIDPLSPREMRGWLQLRKELVAQSAEIQDRRGEVVGLEAKLAACRRWLGQELAALGEPAAASDEPLASFRGRAEAALKQLVQAEARRGKLVESRDKLKRQIEAAQLQAHALEQRLDAWRGRWAAAVAPLGLAADVTTEHAGAMIDQVAELQARIKEARDLQARIANLRRDAEQFGRDVREVCTRVAPELTPDDAPGSPSVEMAASELLRRFRLAGEARTARGSLIEQREAQSAAARDAERALEAADRQLDALCRQAQCGAVDDLPRVEEQSAQARELDHRLKVLDEQIRELCGHEAPDEFRRAALALDLDRLPDRLQHLADEIARLDSERGEFNRALGREQQILKQMDGSARAAEAAEMAEELKARLAVDVEEYARLRLAAVILRESIERYRRRSQGTVLDCASALFARLTLGSFEGLRIDYDEQDQAVLKAVRPGGDETVGIEGLSLGTADQLYLALRLASLEAYLDGHEPVPLIVDDVLIQFDDERAAAALEALAEVSRRTQVVLFTHHEHVCQIAQGCVDPDQLVVHCLPGRQAAGLDGRLSLGPGR